jgi:hypothetical protein
MTRCRRRILFDNDRAKLLNALAACRSAACHASGQVEISGPTYITLAVLLESLDDVAGTLTGRLDYLHDATTGDHRP